MNNQYDLTKKSYGQQENEEILLDLNDRENEEEIQNVHQLNKYFYLINFTIR